VNLHHIVRITEVSLKCIKPPYGVARWWRDYEWVWWT